MHQAESKSDHLVQYTKQQSRRASRLQSIYTREETSLLAFSIGTAAVLVVARNADDAAALLLLEHPARLHELWPKHLARTSVRADVPDLQPGLAPGRGEHERVVRGPSGREDLALSGESV